MPIDERGSAGPGAGDPPTEPDRGEEGVAVTKPDVTEPVAPRQAAPGDAPLVGGDLQADVATPGPGDPDGRQVDVAPDDADLPEVMPDWGMRR
ncbi:hypothetical protein ElP_73100 (plasmid) [Tautonia plasticadhaerens]|uniref:Uncharacterized protein n=1 Tax=Tautonia plasticadhaerens TaxID=2527974 RepID=A0A518HET1_9BACT|nr:hypothetical protein ElP_73100 [Tautonia plasticadhaerens]